MSLFKITVQGNLTKFLAAERKAAERAVTTAMRRASTNLKNEMRRQVKKAGMGERLANTWRGDVYPNRGTSLSAAAVVYSKASYMKAFENGEIIRAGGGRWLAIPTEVVYIGSKRQRPRDVKARMWFVPTNKPNVARLVTRHGGQEKTLFILVKQVQLRKKIDFATASAKWHARIPDYIASEWNRASKRAGIE